MSKNQLYSSQDELHLQLIDCEYKSTNIIKMKMSKVNCKQQTENIFRSNSSYLEEDVEIIVKVGNGLHISDILKVCLETTNEGRVMEFVRTNKDTEFREVYLSLQVEESGKEISIASNFSSLLNTLDDLTNSDTFGLFLEHNAHFDFKEIKKSEMSYIDYFLELLMKAKREFEFSENNISVKEYSKRSFSIKSLGLAILKGKPNNSTRQCQIFDIKLMRKDGSDGYYSINEIIKKIKAIKDTTQGKIIFKETGKLRNIDCNNIPISEIIETIQKIKYLELQEDEIDRECYLKDLIDYTEKYYEWSEISKREKYLPVRRWRLKRVFCQTLDHKRLDMTIILLQVFEKISSRLASTDFLEKISQLVLNPNYQLHNAVFDLLLLYWKLFVSVFNEKHTIEAFFNSLKKSFNDMKPETTFIWYNPSSISNDGPSEQFRKMSLKKSNKAEIDQMSERQSQFKRFLTSEIESLHIETLWKPEMTSLDAVMTLMFYVYIDKKSNSTNETENALHFVGYSVNEATQISKPAETSE